MKTIEINLYKFSELSEEAKQKAIEKLSDINVTHEWWETTYMDAEDIGLKITAFDLDRNRHAKGEFLIDAIEVAEKIFENHGKDCETYKTADAFKEAYYKPDADIEEEENHFLKSLLEDYSIMLQKEMEYLSSEKPIIETIEANDYDFTEDGKLY